LNSIRPGFWRVAPSFQYNLKSVNSIRLENFVSVPTLLWWSYAVELEPLAMLQAILLTIIILGVDAILLPKKRWQMFLILSCLWIGYLSLVAVSQDFGQFQWDILLLEIGFLAIFLPVMPNETVGLLIRWLFFRLMFSSGYLSNQFHKFYRLVKWTEGDETWWRFTATTFHYETQPLPTPLAWFAHHLPFELHRISCVIMFIIEVALPWLVLLPPQYLIYNSNHFRWIPNALRKLNIYSQILLQILIILTGNYTFFNILTIFLAYFCLETYKPKKFSGSILSYAMLTLVMIPVLGWSGWTIGRYLELIPEDMRILMPAAIWSVLLSMGFMLLTILYETLAPIIGIFQEKKLSSIGKFIIHVAGCVFTIGMFLITLAPFTHRLSARPEFQKYAGPLSDVSTELFLSAQQFRICSSYGLFASMIVSRDEIIIQGSLDANDWKEYQFKYKPGNTTRAPPIVLPHQPRYIFLFFF
jgi:hypothetical protein